MRKFLLAGAAGLAMLFGSASLQASPYDDQPGPGWQSAATLQSQLTSQGWQVDRIKADDGNWEVYGRDPSGQYVEAKYDPYTLQQTSMKVKSGSSSDFGKPKKDDRGRDKGGKDGKGH